MKELLWEEDYITPGDHVKHEDIPVLPLPFSSLICNQSHLKTGPSTTWSSDPPGQFLWHSTSRLFTVLAGFALTFIPSVISFLKGSLW